MRKAWPVASFSYFEILSLSSQLRMTTERISELRARLRAQGADPRDLDLLIADATGQSRAWLLAHGETLIDAIT